MRILVISDIHANLTAFQAVLEAAKGEWDKIWCLGDIIGYGPDPNECVELLQQYDHLTLTGNHDWAALGRIDIESFNADAKQAIIWTGKQLTPENHSYLEQKPPILTFDPFTLAHGSPRHPVWEYITDSFLAWENLEHFKTPYCLVGHTHYPVVFEQDDVYGALGYHADYENPLELFPTKRMLLNPGSVGQPRDSDPRAAYALLNLETLVWQHRRVPYDIAATQARMAHHKLPSRLIARLQYGW